MWRKKISPASKDAFVQVVLASWWRFASISLRRAAFSFCKLSGDAVIYFYLTHIFTLSVFLPMDFFVKSDNMTFTGPVVNLTWFFIKGFFKQVFCHSFHIMGGMNMLMAGFCHTACLAIMGYVVGNFIR